MTVFGVLQFNEPLWVYISIPIAALPHSDNSRASGLGIILATLIFQPHRWLGFRARWFDRPV